MAGSSYTEVIADLSKAAVPVRELSLGGRVAVTLAAGRVIAMAFSPQEPNLLWSNPQLHDADLVKNHPEKLAGGLGGERLWFAPELAYHWDGMPDWESFANYKLPAAMDPGAYEFVKQDERSITLRAAGEIPRHGSDLRVGFELERTIRNVESPLATNDPLMSSVEYVGIEESNSLSFAESTRKGVLDLWQLLQVPVGSVLIVPLKKGVGADLSRPVSYALQGSWLEKPDHIMWRYGGKDRAKFGLSAAALTGRSAVLRKLAPERWCMILRQFSADPNARYCDHPYGMPRHDQAFQAWDGFGFGEMEYHSRALDAQSGPRELRESNQLWAFGGSASAIAALGSRLLGVDIAYVFVD